MARRHTRAHKDKRYFFFITRHMTHGSCRDMKDDVEIQICWDLAPDVTGCKTRFPSTHSLLPLSLPSISSFPLQCTDLLHPQLHHRCQHFNIVSIMASKLAFTFTCPRPYTQNWTLYSHFFLVTYIRCQISIDSVQWPPLMSSPPDIATFSRGHCWPTRSTRILYL